MQRCFKDIHHEYYPKRDYRTPTEVEFRELPENKVEMCRNEHNDLHYYELPPEKPPREVMIAAIAAAALAEAS